MSQEHLKDCERSRRIWAFNPANHSPTPCRYEDWILYHSKWEVILTEQATPAPPHEALFNSGLSSTLFRASWSLILNSGLDLFCRSLALPSPLRRSAPLLTCPYRRRRALSLVRSNRSWKRPSYDLIRTCCAPQPAGNFVSIIYRFHEQFM